MRFDGQRRFAGTRVVLAALTAFTLTAACGDDDDDEGDAAATTTEAVAGGDAVEVTATDYAFQDLPAQIDAGTEVTLTNSSAVELHEFVAFRLPDGEARPVQELAMLPQGELEALFAGPPATVVIAPPSGAPSFAAVGDGTLSQPGRYFVACFIPVGADPQEYLAAAQQSQGEPPQVEGGPPHFTRGMFGEVTVQ